MSKRMVSQENSLKVKKLISEEKQINVLFNLNELYELLTCVNYYRLKKGEKIIYGQKNELGREYAGYKLDRYLNNLIVKEESN